MKRAAAIALAVMLPILALAQDLEIVSFQHNGLVTWTNAPEHSNRTYRVEWSDDLLSNVWCASWATLTNIPHSAGGMSAAVPMFYRVVMNPRTIFVTTNGNDISGDGTTSAPLATIQKAIDVAGAGDTVIVRTGTYSGSGNRDLNMSGKSINIISESGPLDTIIDCGGVARAMTFAGGETNMLVRGFTICNGYDNPNISKPYGAIIWLGFVAATPVFENCMIVSNRVGSDDGTIYANINYTHSDVYTSTYVNCVFADNVLQAGSSTFRSAMLFTGARLLNCTVAANSCIGAHGSIGDRTTIQNSIIWSNSITDGAFGSSRLTILSSDVQPDQLFIGTDNISTNPLFADPSAGNYRLSSNSPCIDKGTNSYVTSSTDILGNPRIVNGTVDMGAFEKQ